MNDFKPCGGRTGGTPTPQVAEMVFDAIRQEKFYILTHPTTKQAVQLRMEDILQERMPTDIFQAAQQSSFILRLPGAFPENLLTFVISPCKIHISY